MIFEYVEKGGQVPRESRTGTEDKAPKELVVLTGNDISKEVRLVFCPQVDLSQSTERKYSDEEGIQAKIRSVAIDSIRYVALRRDLRAVERHVMPHFEGEIVLS